MSNTPEGTGIITPNNGLSGTFKTREAMLLEKGLSKPEAIMQMVTVIVRKIQLKDSVFFLMEGNHTGTNRIFSCNFSENKGNMLNLNSLCDNEEHTLKLIVELHKAGLTGYIKDDQPIAHKSTGWTAGKIMKEITAASPEYTNLVLNNKELNINYLDLFSMVV